MSFELKACGAFPSSVGLCYTYRRNSVVKTGASLEHENYTELWDPDSVSRVGGSTMAAVKENKFTIYPVFSGQIVGQVSGIQTNVITSCTGWTTVGTHLDIPFTRWKLTFRARIAFAIGSGTSLVGLLYYFVSVNGTAGMPHGRSLPMLMMYGSNWLVIIIFGEALG